MSTPKHHPDPAMLVEFSAGTLETAQSICVAAHLHFCEQCRNEVLRLDQIGSQLLSEVEPESVDSDLFDSVMSKIDNLPESEEIRWTPKDHRFPFPVAKLFERAEVEPEWKKMSASVDVAQLVTGQTDYEVSLHKICAGGKTPKHSHSGKEYTVVLEGSFSDESSVYSEGDFILREEGDEHQPMGAQNGECICLSALQAPIKLSSPFGFLMKPWLRLNPM